MFKYVWIALRDHCKYEENWSLPRRKRIAYTIKCIVCVILHREDITGRDDPIEVGYLNFCRTYSFEYGEGAEWDYLAVAHGWKQWRFSVGSTGYP